MLLQNTRKIIFTITSILISRKKPHLSARITVNGGVHDVCTAAGVLFPLVSQSRPSLVCNASELDLGGGDVDFSTVGRSLPIVSGDIRSVGRENASELSRSPRRLVRVRLCQYSRGLRVLDRRHLHPPRRMR